MEVDSKSPKEHFGLGMLSPVAAFTCQVDFVITYYCSSNTSLIVVLQSVRVSLDCVN